MNQKRILLAVTLSSLALNGSWQNSQAQESAPAKVAAELAKTDPPKVYAGTENFEEANRIRINANSIEQLQEVLELCQSAIDKGLDEIDLAEAKKMLGATAFQKAQESVESLMEQKGPASKSRTTRVLNQAFQDLTIAIANDPANFESYILMAKIQITRQEISKALDSLDKAVSKLKEQMVAEGSESSELKNKLSDVFVMRSVLRQDADDRLNDLKAALEADPSNQRAVQQRVETLFALDRVDDAISTLQSYLALAPENLIAIANLTQAFLRTDKTDEAIALLTDKIKLLPTIGDLVRMRGNVYLMKKDYDSALTDMNKAVELNGMDIEAKLNRARILIIKDDVASAKKDVDEVLQLKPTLVDGIQLRATIAIQEARVSEAIDDVEKLVQNFPDNNDLLLQLAGLYQMDNRPKKALRAVDRVLNVDRENWQALRLRGDALLALGRHKDAIEDYESAIKYVPEDDEDVSGILNNLSWVMSTSPIDDIRNGKRALELGLRACELTKYEKPHILSTLAAAYAELGQFDKAIEWSEKAVEIGRQEKHNQVDQLEEELESYRNNKPWREKQEIEEKKPRAAPVDSGVDT